MAEKMNSVLTVVLTDKSKSLITQASALGNESVASFMRRTALAEANRILREVNDSA